MVQCRTVQELRGSLQKLLVLCSKEPGFCSRNLVFAAIPATFGKTRSFIYWRLVTEPVWAVQELSELFASVKELEHESSIGKDSFFPEPAVPCPPTCPLPPLTSRTQELCIWCRLGVYRVRNVDLSRRECGREVSIFGDLLWSGWFLGKGGVFCVFYWGKKTK